MSSTSKCPYCDGTLSSKDKLCTHCGAPNANYTEDTPRQIFLPKTIEELKEYCAERGMPLLRMRFFIGEDFKEPRAFGIYKDGERFVVYKNKDNGSRAVRYQGPDEAYAVNELFQKLLSECHNRGIYPDGKPAGNTDSADPGNRKSDRGARNGIIIAIVLPLMFILLGIFGGICSSQKHKNDGYYKFDNSSATWYLYGGDWYYSDGSSNWYSGDPGVSDYAGYYAGDDFDSDWGETGFRDSDTWDSISSSSGDSDSSSDYGSWDSGGTDWSSDW